MHDTKNLLWAAGGYAALLEEGLLGELTPEQRMRVGRIRALVGEAERALGRALTTVLGMQEPSAVSPARVDLAPLLAACADRYRAAAERAGLELAVDHGAGEATLRTDAGHVESIVGNLLVNAIQYTPAGGRVVVRARVLLEHGDRSRARVVIEVRDSGPGIPAELRERVFDEYFRAHPGGGVDGSGVGLAASRRLARELGGDLVAAPAEPPPGALLRLLLPMR